MVHFRKNEDRLWKAGIRSLLVFAALPKKSVDIQSEGYDSFEYYYRNSLKSDIQKYKFM